MHSITLLLLLVIIITLHSKLYLEESIYYRKQKQGHITICDITGKGNRNKSIHNCPICPPCLRLC